MNKLVNLISVIVFLITPFGCLADVTAASTTFLMITAATSSRTRSRSSSATRSIGRTAVSLKVNTLLASAIKSNSSSRGVLTTSSTISLRPSATKTSTGKSTTSSRVFSATRSTGSSAPSQTIHPAASSIVASIVDPIVHSTYNSTPKPTATELGTPLPNKNFPDPAIIWAEGKWWAFATGNRGGRLHFQLASSVDYRNWTLVSKPSEDQYDPLPVLPAWVDRGQYPDTWAPDVVKLDDGTFVMYYSAKLNGTNSTHCVSASTSRNVAGPYTPLNDILVCPAHSLGAFDVSGFKDWQYKGDWSLPIGDHDVHPRRTHCSKNVGNHCGNSYVDDLWSEGGYGGQRYIVYKVQNANNTFQTPITLQAVGDDGITLIDDPITILEQEDVTEDFESIEAPSLYKTPNGKYVLTYSKGNTATPHYTVSYAVATNVTGPYTLRGDLLKTGDYGLNGPGGADFNFNGERMLFHEMAQPIGDVYANMRVMHAADICVKEDNGDIVIQAL